MTPIYDLKSGLSYFPTIIGMQPLKGARFDPFESTFDAIHERDLKILSQSADFIRISGMLNLPYSKGKRKLFLDRAFSANIKVIASFSFSEYRDSALDTSFSAIKADFQEFISSFENHPAVIGRCLGDDDDAWRVFADTSRTLLPSTLYQTLIGAAKTLTPSIPIAAVVTAANDSNSANLGKVFVDLPFDFFIYDAVSETVAGLNKTFEVYPGGDKPAILQIGASSFDMAKGDVDEKLQTQALQALVSWVIQGKALHNNSFIAPLGLEFSDQWWRYFALTGCDPTSAFFQSSCGRSKNYVDTTYGDSLFDSIQYKQFNNWGYHCIGTRDAINVFGALLNYSWVEPGTIQCSSLLVLESLVSITKLVWLGLGLIIVVISLLARGKRATVGVEKHKEAPVITTPQEFSFSVDGFIPSNKLLQEEMKRGWTNIEMDNEKEGAFSSDMLVLHARVQRSHIRSLYHARLERTTGDVNERPLKAWTELAQDLLKSFFKWRKLVDSNFQKKIWLENAQESPALKEWYTSKMQRVPENFAEIALEEWCVAYRSIISLAEDGVHAPSQFNLCFLQCEREGWNPHKIAAHLLYSGVAEINHNTKNNIFERMACCCFRARPVHGDIGDTPHSHVKQRRARNGRKVLLVQPAKKTVKVPRFDEENTGIFFFVNLINFRKILYVKYWLLLCTYYLNTHVWHDPPADGSIGWNLKFWPSFLFIDALVFLSLESIVLVIDSQNCVSFRGWCGNSICRYVWDFFLRNVLSVLCAAGLLVLYIYSVELKSPIEYLLLARFAVFTFLELVRFLRHRVWNPWHSFALRPPKCGMEELRTFLFWPLSLLVDCLLYKIAHDTWVILCSPTPCAMDCINFLHINQCVAYTVGVALQKILVLGCLCYTFVLPVSIVYLLGHRENPYFVSNYRAAFFSRDNKQIRSQFKSVLPTKKEIKKAKADRYKLTVQEELKSEEQKDFEIRGLKIWVSIIDDAYGIGLIDRLTRREILSLKEQPIENSNREAHDRLLFFLNSAQKTCIYTTKAPLLTMSITAYSEPVLLSKEKLKVEIVDLVRHYKKDWENFVLKEVRAKYSTREFREGFLRDLSTQFPAEIENYQQCGETREVKELFWKKLIDAYHNQWEDYCQRELHPETPEQYQQSFIDGEFDHDDSKLLAIRLWASCRLQTVGTIRGCVSYLKTLDVHRHCIRTLSCFPEKNGNEQNSQENNKFSVLLGASDFKTKTQGKVANQIDGELIQALKVPEVCEKSSDKPGKNAVMAEFCEYIYTRTTGPTGKCMGDDEFAVGTISRLRNQFIRLTDIIEWQKRRETFFLLESDFLVKNCSGFVGMQHSRDFRRLMDRPSLDGQPHTYFGTAGFYATNFLAFIYVCLMGFVPLTVGGISLHGVGKAGSSLISKWLITTGMLSFLPLFFEEMLHYGAACAFYDVFVQGLLRPWSSFLFHVFQNAIAVCALGRAAFTGLASWINTGRKSFYPYHHKSQSYIPHFVYKASDSQFEMIFLFFLYQRFEIGGAHPLYFPVITAAVWILAPVLLTPHLHDGSLSKKDFKKAFSWLARDLQKPYLAAESGYENAGFSAFWTWIKADNFGFSTNFVASMLYGFVAAIVFATSFSSVTDRLFLILPMIAFYLLFTFTWRKYGGFPCARAQNELFSEMAAFMHSIKAVQSFLQRFADKKALSLEELAASSSVFRKTELLKTSSEDVYELIRSKSPPLDAEIAQLLWRAIRAENSESKPSSSVATTTATATLREAPRTSFSQGKYLCGRGQYGVAYLARCGSELVVVKAIRTANHEQRNKFHQQVVALSKVKSAFLVEILDIFEEADEHSCLALSYCAGGIVADLLCKAPVPLEFVMRVVREAARNLKELHAKQMVHRNIKPDNLFFNNLMSWGVRIGDFGPARVADVGLYAAGCKPYLAPEEMFSVTPAIDMWALGCVSVCLLSGVRIEQRYEEKQWVLGSKSQDAIDRFLKPLLVKMSGSALAEITISLLRRDVARRMTAAEVVRKLAAYVVYVPDRTSNLEAVENLKRRICNEFHDVKRSQAKAWENVCMYARTSHLLLAQVMESTLVSKLAPDSVLKSYHIIAATPSGAMLGFQTPAEKTADGLLAPGLAAEVSFRHALGKVLREYGFAASQLLVAGVKGKDRVVEKMMDDGFHIFEMNCATIVCEAEKYFEVVSRALTKVFGQALRFKNLFAVDWHDLASPPCYFFNCALPESSLAEFVGARWVVEGARDAVTEHMAKLGSSFDTNYFHVDVKNAIEVNPINIVMIDVPGLKPIDQGNDRANAQIASIIEKEVGYPDAVPIFMTSIPTTFDFEFCLVSLKRLVRVCKNAPTLSRAIVVCSCLDRVTDVTKEHLDKFIETVKKAGLPTDNIVFLSLKPERLLGDNSESKESDDFDTINEYFKSQVMQLDVTNMARFRRDLKLTKEDEKKYKLGIRDGLLKCYNQKLKDYVLQNFDEIRAQLEGQYYSARRDVECVMDDLKTNIPTRIQDFNIMMLEVVAGVASTEDWKVGDAMRKAQQKYPFDVKSTDVYYPILERVRKTFLEEFDEAARLTNSEGNGDAVPFSHKILEEMSKGSHAIEKDLLEKYSPGKSVHRLLTSANYLLMTYPLKQFTPQELLDYGGLGSADDVRGFSVNYVIRKMLNEYKNHLMVTLRFVLKWAARLYYSQVEIACEEVSKVTNILGKNKSLEKFLQTRLINQYKKAYMSESFEALDEVEKMINFRFHVLRPEEIYSSIRLLCCCGLSKDLVAHDDEKRDLVERATDMLTPAATLLNEVRGKNPTTFISAAFDVFQRVRILEKDFAASEGMNFRAFSRTDVYTWSERINKTAQMLGRFNAGQILLNTVGFAERRITTFSTRKYSQFEEARIAERSYIGMSSLLSIEKKIQVDLVHVQAMCVQIKNLCFGERQPLILIAAVGMGSTSSQISMDKDNDKDMVFLMLNDLDTSKPIQCMANAALLTPLIEPIWGLTRRANSTPTTMLKFSSLSALRYCFLANGKIFVKSARACSSDHLKQSEECFVGDLCSLCATSIRREWKSDNRSKNTVNQICKQHFTYIRRKYQFDDIYETQQRLLNEFIDVINKCRKDTRQPIIALKSGCLIMLKDLDDPRTKSLARSRLCKPLNTDIEHDFGEFLAPRILVVDEGSVHVDRRMFCISPPDRDDTRRVLKVSKKAAMLDQTSASLLSGALKLALDSVQDDNWESLPVSHLLQFVEPNTKIANFLAQVRGPTDGRGWWCSVRQTLASGANLVSFTYHALNACRWRHDGDCIVCGYGVNLWVWNVNSGRQYMQQFTMVKQTCAQHSDDQFAVEDDDKVRIWHLSGKCIIVDRHQKISAVAWGLGDRFAIGRNHLFECAWKDSMSIKLLTQGRVTSLSWNNSCEHQSKHSEMVTWCHKGRTHICSASADHKVHTWETITSREQTMHDHTGPVTSVVTQMDWISSGAICGLFLAIDIGRFISGSLTRTELMRNGGEHAGGFLCSIGGAYAAKAIATTAAVSAAIAPLGPLALAAVRVGATVVLGFLFDWAFRCAYRKIWTQLEVRRAEKEAEQKRIQAMAIFGILPSYNCSQAKAIYKQKMLQIRVWNLSTQQCKFGDEQKNLQGYAGPVFLRATITCELDQGLEFPRPCAKDWRYCVPPGSLSSAFAIPRASNVVHALHRHASARDRNSLSHLQHCLCPSTIEKENISNPNLHDCDGFTLTCRKFFIEEMILDGGTLQQDQKGYQWFQSTADMNREAHSLHGNTDLAGYLWLRSTADMNREMHALHGNTQKMTWDTLRAHVKMNVADKYPDQARSIMSYFDEYIAGYRMQHPANTPSLLLLDLNQDREIPHATIAAQIRYALEPSSKQAGSVQYPFFQKLQALGLKSDTSQVIFLSTFSASCAWAVRFLASRFVLWKFYMYSKDVGELERRLKLTPPSESAALVARVSQASEAAKEWRWAGSSLIKPSEWRDAQKFAPRKLPFARFTLILTVPSLTVLAFYKILQSNSNSLQ